MLKFAKHLLTDATISFFLRYSTKVNSKNGGIMFNLKLLIFLIFITSLAFIQAQDLQKKPMVKSTTRMKGDDVAMLFETGTVFIEENGKSFIKFIPPAVAINKEYKDLDFKKNDQIIFINGKRVKKLKDFKSVYNSLKPGDEIELGIKRKDSKFFVKFPKADSQKSKSRIKIMPVEE